MASGARYVTCMCGRRAKKVGIKMNVKRKIKLVKVVSK